MSIFVGSKEILAGDLKIGGSDIQEVYVGSQKIWPAAPPSNDIHYATLYFEPGTQTLYVTNEGVSGVYVLIPSMGGRVDIPDNSVQYSVNVGPGSEALSAEVYFDNSKVTDETSRLVFDSNGKTAPSLINATIHSWGNIQAANYLFHYCSLLENVTVEDTRPVIIDGLKIFAYTSISGIVDMNYGAMISPGYAYQGCPLDGEISLNLPVAGSIGFLFDADTHPNTITKITLGAPIAYYWKKVFNEVNAEFIEVEINDTATNTHQTFLACHNLKCIKGVIDTTNSEDKNTMFNDCYVLEKPNSTEQTDLMDADGAYWTNDSCDETPSGTLYASILIGQDGDMYVSIEDISGVYVMINGATRIDIPDMALYEPVSVSANDNVEVYYDPATMNSNSKIVFGAQSGSTAISQITLKELGQMTSLRWLASNNVQLNTVSSDVPTTQITDWSYAFENTRISAIPSLDFSGAIFLIATFAGTNLSGSINLNCPNAYMLTDTFANIEFVTSIQFQTDEPISNADQMFYNCPALETLAVVLRVTNGNTIQTFANCPSLTCITGVIHATGDTTDMFDGSDALVDPDAAAQQDIMVGTEWTNESCP